MSTRRTTRTTSKAASSRGASPAITESDIPATPSARRSRKAGSTTPLPAIAGRSSNAYGTNTTAQPASLKIPESGQEINSALNSILQPQPKSQSNHLSTVREEDTPDDLGISRSGRVSSTIGRRYGRGHVLPDTSIDDRSFGNESRIFGDAGLESSVASPSEIGTPESPPAPVRPLALSSRSQREARERLEREKIHRDNARKPVARRHEQATASHAAISQWKTRWTEKGLNGAANLIAHVRQVWAWILTHLPAIGLASAAALLLVLFLSSGSYRWYGLDFKHNVGQFVPDFVAHPINKFSPYEIKDLQTRLTTAEYDIAYLKKRSDIDENAISHLKESLPEHILVKRGTYGKLEITQGFWHALESKMRSENAYLHPRTAVKPSKDSSTTNVSLAHVEKLLANPKTWDRFLQTNRAQLKELASEELDASFPNKFKKSIEVNKSEFIELVRENWEESQKEIKKEIRRLSTQIDDAIRNVQRSEGHVVGHTKEQIKAISTDVFRTLFSTSQLEALAKANKNINAAANEHRLNHFSPGTGATINPKLTSPNYLFPSMDRNFIVKTLSRVLWHQIPSPNPPEVALQRWQEHGDCWCSPSRDAEGFGPSLAVIMANQIYPDQIIVEHIPPSGSLEPGAAPKEMELLAYIEDQETYHTIKRRSDDIFYEEALEDEPQPFGFVRIATWTYDAQSMSNIQSFPLQIDLGTVKGLSHTNRLIVRSKNNWGEGEVDFTCLYRIRVNGEIAPRS